MSESRHELLAWLNQLTSLDITKVEQCGKGYVYAHVFDSIYGGVPFRKINFNCNNEYQYIQNWRVIQSIFTQHKIDKIICVDRLIKCKFQDNLEFLQWVKKFWDQHYNGVEYNALGRREVRPSISIACSARPVSAHNMQNRKTLTVNTTSMRVSPNPTTTFLNSQIQALQENVAGLEKERDFYFNKLRDIEILIQAAIDVDPSAAQNEESLLKQIQNILYSTEEGFEVPDINGDEINKQIEGLQIEDETF
ncbi:unnamed protein product [Pneumocystis jirovecii]|uniref:EB1 C-terminal domain-containing protein n=2 Tax=Pneumocystis jirovecii TaxID=42068 RepID=L0P8S1_PNEJI|nr:microtubule-binding protein BIM1 [Pneumocystis jirovecii RU7]KTW32780.1 hypothetical protein T551_00265 [Pneumocystis jirovecii RU7]CCJ28791.1 unnamed protein product [Pneumocystis jirovecii]